MITSSKYVRSQPWISHDQVPPLRREFDLSRSEYIKRQMLAMEKTEAERRKESTERGSDMVGKGTASPALKPPPKIRDPVDREHFNTGWLQEQRDAALAQHREPQVNTPSHDHSRPHHRQR